MTRQLVLFFLLAYAISWLTWLPLYAPALGIGMAGPFSYQHALGALGPMLAGLIVVYRYNGLKGLGNLVLSSLVPTGIIYLLVAMFSPFLLQLIAAVIRYAQSGEFPGLSQIGRSNEFPDLSVISFFFYNLLFFGFGEEVGWRGFALPKLQAGFSALTSSIILAGFWAVWHWPLFLYRPGYVSMDLEAALGWIVSMLTGSILLTWLFNSSRGSVLACAVFHSAIDVAFTADHIDQDQVTYMGMLITLWGIATVVIFKPLDLSSTRKFTGSAAGG